MASPYDQWIDEIRYALNQLPPSTEGVKTLESILLPISKFFRELAKEGWLSNVAETPTGSGVQCIGQVANSKYIHWLIADCLSPIDQDQATIRLATSNSQNGPLIILKEGLYPIPHSEKDGIDNCRVMLDLIVREIRCSS